MSDDGNQLLENLMGALGDNPAETIGKLMSSLSQTEDDGKNDNEENSENSGGMGIDLDMIMKLQRLMSQLSGDNQDERSALLFALKPFLSEERRAQIDKAVKLLKLSSLAKTAQELDLFKNLL